MLKVYFVIFMAAIFWIFDWALNLIGTFLLWPI